MESHCFRTWSGCLSMSQFRSPSRINSDLVYGARRELRADRVQAVQMEDNNTQKQSTKSNLKVECL